MNILVIIPYNIFEVQENSSGNEIRVKALLESLIQNGCNLTLLMYGFPWKNKVRSGNKFKAYFFSIRVELLLLAFLASKLFKTTIYDLALSKFSPIYYFQRRLRNILNHESIDLIQCENVPTVPLIRELPHHIPVIVTAHDIQAKRCEQRYAWANASKALARHCLKEMQRLEIEKLKFAKFRVCVSEGDREAFVNMGINPSRLSVIPNGVDTKKIFPMEKSLPLLEKLRIDKGDPVLMFSGSDMFHNAQVATDIIKIILPEVIKAFPHIRMIFVGKICSYIQEKNMHSLFSRNIVLCNYVPEINPFYSIIDIYLLPSIYGTGSSLKAIEALAAGKPLISTPIGVRGYNLMPGKHYILEEDIHKFSQRITALLENQVLMKRLAIEARNIALDYDWSSLMKRYLKIYETVLHKEK